MKRTILTALMGASFLMPIHAEAQRGRVRHSPASRTAVVTAATARLANCRAPSDGRSYVCRNVARPNVVYRYSGRPSYGSGLSWVSVRWGRIWMVPSRRMNRSGMLNQGALIRMLGPRTVDQIRDVGRRHGLRGQLRGYWLESRGWGAVLTVSMGGRDVVELVDFNRDGLVDRVLVDGFDLDRGRRIR